MIIPKPIFKPFNPYKALEITDSKNKKGIILENYSKFYIAILNKNNNEKIYLPLKDIIEKELKNAR